MQNYLLVVAVTLSLTNMCYADVPNTDRVQSDTVVQNHISDGDKFIDKGNYLAAADAYKKALALDPQNGNAYAGLGVVDYIQKNFHKAIESFEKAEEYGVQGHWIEGVYAHHGHVLLQLVKMTKRSKFLKN